MSLGTPGVRRSAALGKVQPVKRSPPHRHLWAIHHVLGAESAVTKAQSLPSASFFALILGVG